MNSFLLNRQLGSIAPEVLVRAQHDRLLKALQPASHIRFALQPPAQTPRNHAPRTVDLAHAAGVNSIAVDRFEGRYLISGGADSSLAIWDLEAAETYTGEAVTHLPLTVSARTSITQSLGITHVSFYPFDSLALLTTGYDHTLKLFSSETLETSTSFDLGSIVYSHATSHIASHLLVACASQHPAVRLVDLRSGSATHSLAGHSGAVLSVSWHPKQENILASGGTDGVVRLWDVRKSASSLGVLDMEDNIGIAGYDGLGTGSRRREKGRAHNGATNGLVWSDDGRFLVTTGHDERVRVWNMDTGANTLANFGPGLKNATTTTLLPFWLLVTFQQQAERQSFTPIPKRLWRLTCTMAHYRIAFGYEARHRTTRRVLAILRTERHLSHGALIMSRCTLHMEMARSDAGNRRLQRIWLLTRIRERMSTVELARWRIANENAMRLNRSWRI